MNTSYLRRLRTPGALKAILSDRTSNRHCKRLVIDYSSPNIAKQFHIGNLRSTLIGRYLEKVHRTIGDHVTSVNYLGDWGTQFAMIATYWPQECPNWSRDIAVGVFAFYKNSCVTRTVDAASEKFLCVRPSDAFWESCSDTDKIRTLTDCYVVANKKSKADENFRDQVRETFSEMEQCLENNDMSSPTMQLWQDIRKVSEHHLKHFYNMLNIQFDSWQYESSYVIAARRLAADLVQDKTARATATGVWVVDLPEGELEEYAVIRKSDHTTLYLSRELACILNRDEIFHADRYMYVVDRAQRKHFEALRTILRRIGREDLAEKIEHVPYGRVKGLSTRVPDKNQGEKMGRTEAVAEIIGRGTELALQFMMNSKTVKVPPEKEEEVARQLSLSTVIFNDLKRAKSAEYEFSFKNAFDLNHNNALLLQIRHSRLCSIEANNAELLPLLDECESIPIENPEFAKLAEQLARFPEVVIGSAEHSEPCQLIVYLIELSHYIGYVISKAKIKGQPVDVAIPRLLLLSASRAVLNEGITLLGAPPVVAM